ncbi:MAG TPA: hypothetical protein VMN56_01345 [Casimicrobiaceae bacterium]|nr:hypothetical protein [Casimicrobiaceae bacterium]
MSTTTVTDRQIASLMDRADFDGDVDLSRLCQIALTGVDTLEDGREVRVSDDDRAAARQACAEEIRDDARICGLEMWV